LNRKCPNHVDLYIGKVEVNNRLLPVWPQLTQNKWKLYVWICHGPLQFWSTGQTYILPQKQ